MTDKSHVVLLLVVTISLPPSLSFIQNIAWALTRDVNFTRIIDDLWYRDITNIEQAYIDDFGQVGLQGNSSVWAQSFVPMFCGGSNAHNFFSQ